ncbi:MAG TPA: sulfatase-like hydrolase/transferase, partial [Acidobacteriota bacterium]|nr:sulfatase-like hydrolase/transferase [Acidobacteriota bacterium]
SFICIFVTLFFLGTLIGQGADRPNFLWILSEDNSKHYLRLFDVDGAPAPNIERLGQEGIIFTRAFSNSPVCSVARTTLITSCYAPRVGTQFHRHIEPAQLPDGWRLFPAYLREAGYYTSNNAKKDYNAVERAGVWDESSPEASWRRRPSPDMPFFHMQTFPASHESSLHFSKEEIDPAALSTDPETVTTAPYHPDTELFRYTRAKYHDQIGVVDDLVGKMVDQLKEDGLLEDTFVFYFGDHGGVLPRSKGYLHETGLHIPLVVRIPQNWRHRVNMPPGSRVEGFVSFVDFGPTLLHLAGLRVPGHMDGRPFLGQGIAREEVETREEVFGYADRFDEKYDLSRSLRKGRFKYIRYYQPFYPDSLQNNYRYNMLAYQQWRNLYREGKLNREQSRFFEPKPVEALYDVHSDPHELRNLAKDPAYADLLEQLRTRLRQELKSWPDLSFFPESYLVEEAMENPVAFGRQHREEIGGLIDLADLSLVSFSQAESRLKQALESVNPWERYWALIVASSFGKQAQGLIPFAKGRLEDSQPLVRARAAEFLGIIGAADPRPPLYEALSSTESPVEALLILNTIVFFADHYPGFPVDVDQIHLARPHPLTERRLQYLRGK